MVDSNGQVKWSIQMVDLNESWWLNESWSIQMVDLKESSSQESFILKSIAASFAGASIPAAIFYFLM